MKVNKALRRLKGSNAVEIEAQHNVRVAITKVNPSDSLNTISRKFLLLGESCSVDGRSFCGFRHKKLTGGLESSSNEVNRVETKSGINSLEKQ